MNPLLDDYQRHYIEAHKSALEAIKQINIFNEHFSQLCNNDKKQLFEQIIAEQASSQLWKLICFGTSN